MNELTYKPGEGYWTRICTAVGVGLLVAWAAAWLWNLTQGLDIPLDDAGNPIVQPAFVQGGAAAIAMIIGGFLIFWLVYHKRSSSEFLIATDGEMKKVNWSTRREVLGATWVVVFLMLFLSLGILVVDIVFRWVFGNVFGLG